MLYHRGPVITWATISIAGARTIGPYLFNDGNMQLLAGIICHGPFTVRPEEARHLAEQKY